MKLKKIALTVTAVALVAAVSIGGTMAFLQDTTETITNTFTMGNVDIAVLERKSDTETYAAEALTYTDVEPGVSYGKDVVIENTTTTSNAAYVRLKVTYNADYVTLGDTGAGWTKTSGGSAGLVTDTFTYDSRALAAGDTTTPAFTQFTVNAKITEGTQIAGADLNIAVVGEAIQTGSFENATDAWDSFETRS